MGKFVSEKVNELESRVMELEKKLLLKQIKILEEKVKYLSDQTDPGTIQEVADRFIERVSTDYEQLLRGMCQDMERAGICTYMDRDDFQQEGYEYLIRWCLPKVVQYSTKGNLWLPYLKRSLKNSFVNLSKKMTAQSRGKEIGGLEFHQENDLFVDDSHNQEEELKVEELASAIASKLRETDRKIFLHCLFPPSDYLTDQKPYHTHHQLKKHISKYFGISESAVVSAFTRIRKTILSCAAV